MYGVDRLAQVNDTNSDYFLGDAIGSTRQLTDASGAITLAQRYDPFGNGVTSTGNATSIFGYTGEQTDSTGLVFLRARYYDPGMGRFLSHDSFPGYLNLPQSQNPYAYVLNNPILYTDPSGKSFEPWFDNTGSQLNNALNQAMQWIQGLGNWQCTEWGQLLMSGGAAAIAFMLKATVILNSYASNSREYVGEFLLGFLKEAYRVQLWFNPVPSVQRDVAIKGNEPTAMLLGRLLADILSAVLVAYEFAAVVGVGGTGVVECGTGVLC